MIPEERTQAIDFLEAQILGSILNSPNGTPIPKLPNQIFTTHKHRVIVQAINLCAQGDLPTVVAKLTETNDIKHAGGIAYISSLMDTGPTFVPQNLDLWLKQLREYAKDVELLRRHRVAGEELSQGRDPAEVLKTLSKQTTEALAHTGINPLLAHSLTAQNLMEDPPLKPNYLLGDMIPIGSLNLLSAIPGAGKSWLCLQLAACLSVGHEFLIWKTRACNVGYIGFEIPDFTAYERLQTIQQVIPYDPHRIHLLVPPLAPQIDLANPKHIEELTDYCKTLELDFLFLDPLKRFHTLDENSTQDMGHLIDILDTLRKETKTAIFLSHHESTKGDQKARADVDAARGSSVLASHPTLIMRMVPKSKYIQVRVAKTTFGEQPKPVWLAHTDNGYMEICEGPKKSEDEFLDNVNAIKDAGKEEIMKEEAMDLLPHPRTSGTAMRKIMTEAGYERMIGKGSMPWKKVDAGSVKINTEAVKEVEGDLDF